MLLKARTATEGFSESVFPILAWSLGGSPPIYDVLREIKTAHTEIRLYIGPEGGFTREETEMAGEAGVRLASLGENILRTETAVIASLSAICCFLDRKNT